MGRKPKTCCRPSFFKVLINDYTRRLRLPHVFVQKYGEFLPENAKLRPSSGGTWDVKLEQKTCDDDENYWCFTGGWSKILKDLGLKLGEFLVFWFNVGESTYDVSVFGSHCCEKEIPSMDVDSADPHSEDVTNKRSSNNGPLYFEIVLKPHHRSKLCMSRKFYTAGLNGKETVRLKYVPKKSYKCVVVYDRPRYFRMEIGRGWHDFLKENGLVFGKRYSFEFKPTKNVIYVDDVSTS